MSQTVLSLITLLSLPLQASEPQEVDVASPVHSAQLQLSGTLTDDAGEPIDNATVVLISATNTSYRLFDDLNPKRATIEAETDASGRYTLAFHRNDIRFLVNGASRLFVTAKGFRSDIIEVPMARLKVNVAFDVRLKKSNDVRLQVRSADGQPLQAATVFPASVNGRHIPWAAARQTHAETSGADGKVAMKGCTNVSLDGVFLVSPSTGHQRLPVRRTLGGDLYVQAMESRPVNGQFRSPEVDSVPNIADVRIMAISLPPGSLNTWHTPLRCAWATSETTADGVFRISHIGTGTLQYKLSCPADFPYRETYKTYTQTLPAGKDAPFYWNIQLDKQAKLVGTVQDAESNKPLTEMLIDSSDGRLERTFTDGRGIAEFFRNFEAVSYFVRDAKEEFFLETYQSSQQRPVNGVLQLEPTLMNRSSSWQGQVVDQQGNSVPGAKVTYDVSLDQWKNRRTVYTDLAGYFQLSGVADRTTVKLRATNKRSASRQKRAVVGGRRKVRLKLNPQPALRPVGQIVDLNGKPQASVAVTLKRGMVTAQEGSRAEDIVANDAYDSPMTVRTDSAGRFEFPATIDFQQRFRIQITDPNFFPVFSPFMDGAAISRESSFTDGGILNLGRFRIMRKPEIRNVEILVESKNGNPVADADVVIVGARTGTVRASAANDGKLQVTIRQGQSIIAISAAGHQMHLSSMPPLKLQLRFVLNNSNSTPADFGNSNAITNLAPEAFSQAADQILQDVQPPQQGVNTLYHFGLYSQALAATNPEAFLQYIGENLPTNPQLLPGAALGASVALTLQPELVEVALEQDLVPAAYTSGFINTAAAATDDPAQQDEWLAESLVHARNMSGQQRIISLSQLAEIFLASDRKELATTIITELWAEATDLQDLLNSGEQQVLIAESRTFGPMLGMIDLKAAHALIRLTARESEISALQTHATLINAQASPDAFSKRVDSIDCPIIDSRGVASWIRSQLGFRNLATIGLPCVESISAKIDDDFNRLRFLLIHARLTSDERQRKRFLSMAADVVRNSKANGDWSYFGSHYTGAILPQLREFSEIDRASLDRLIFNSLWNLPQHFDTDRLHAILGAAAQIVAYRDRHVARKLLEPAFEDRGWLFMGHSPQFTRNETIASIARIDPEWSVKIVHELCTSELQDSPTLQLELRTGVVKAFRIMQP